MKIQYIVILFLVCQSNFCFANRVLFQDETSFSIDIKTPKILHLSIKKTKEIVDKKANIQSVSNNYVNSTKTPFSTIINTFNIFMLLLFFICYIVFVCIIKLVQRHYMELE